MKSLRLRLVLGLSLTLCVLWGSVAVAVHAHAARTAHHARRAVAGTSSRWWRASCTSSSPRSAPHPRPPRKEALQSVIGRDGVACEVSLVRSEVDVLPTTRACAHRRRARFSTASTGGFGQITKGGKVWRTYVLEHNGLRVATADRLDVREHLVQARWCVRWCCPSRWHWPACCCSPGGSARAACGRCATCARSWRGAPLTHARAREGDTVSSWRRWWTA
ncbi:MAG: hypothetical protein U1E57_06335 [Paenacidovorax caeni]